jgi:uncharacterized membrane protein YbaN (DUF454 family)
MGVKGVLLAGAGVALLLLGLIGLFLPVWPTTPFVLAAFGCLASAPRLRALILRVPFFREYIENYRARRGLKRGTVAASLVFLWGMLSLSVYLTRRFWLALLLTGIGVAVTVHILMVAGPKEDHGDGG